MLAAGEPLRHRYAADVAQRLDDHAALSVKATTSPCRESTGLHPGHRCQVDKEKPLASCIAHLARPNDQRSGVGVKKRCKSRALMRDSNRVLMRFLHCRLMPGQTVQKARNWGHVQSSHQAFST
jgi:hypothetical protein